MTYTVVYLLSLFVIVSSAYHIISSLSTIRLLFHGPAFLRQPQHRTTLSTPQTPNSRRRYTMPSAPIKNPYSPPYQPPSPRSPPRRPVRSPICPGLRNYRDHAGEPLCKHPYLHTLLHAIFPLLAYLAYRSLCWIGVWRSISVFFSGYLVMCLYAVFGEWVGEVMRS